MTTRTRLTPAQRSFYYRLIREAATLSADGGVLTRPGFVARLLVRHGDLPMGWELAVVGHAEMLRRLERAGRLVVAAWDETTPVYALAPGWERDANFALVDAHPVYAALSPSARRQVALSMPDRTASR